MTTIGVKLKPIIWETSRYNSEYGSVGGVQLFTISWGTTRDDPKPWKLSTELPGMTGKRAAASGPDALKGLAEKWLHEHIGRFLA